MLKLFNTIKMLKVRKVSVLSFEEAIASLEMDQLATNEDDKVNQLPYCWILP